MITALLDRSNTHCRTWVSPRTSQGLHYLRGLPSLLICPWAYEPAAHGRWSLGRGARNLLDRHQRQGLFILPPLRRHLQGGRAISRLARPPAWTHPFPRLRFPLLRCLLHLPHCLLPHRRLPQLKVRHFLPAHVHLQILACTRIISSPPYPERSPHLPHFPLLVLLPSRNSLGFRPFSCLLLVMSAMDGLRA